ncbi:MAG: hypothetical protein HY275_09125 [Gemmatimonadetes bacterium]|nr:hypothetical protein [Gemmatimonadota bacterium]
MATDFWAMDDAEQLTAAEWAAGKSPWWRIVVLAWPVLVAYHALKADAMLLEEGSLTSNLVAILGGLDFQVHEFGHLAFSIFPLFLTVLGGTLMQIGLPLAAGLLLWLKQRDWFALSFCAAWATIGIGSAATYCADARALELDLVGLGGDGGQSDGPYTGHDWNYMLSTLGWLNYDLKIARVLRAVGSLLVLLSVLNMLRLTWLMVRAPKAAAS